MVELVRKPATDTTGGEFDNSLVAQAVPFKTGAFAKFWNSTNTNFAAIVCPSTDATASLQFNAGSINNIGGYTTLGAWTFGTLLGALVNQAHQFLGSNSVILSLQSAGTNQNAELRFKSLYTGVVAQDWGLGTNINLTNGSFELHNRTTGLGLFNVQRDGSVIIGPQAYSGVSDQQHTIRGRLVCLGNTDESPSEAILAGTSSGSPGAIQVLTATLSTLAGTSSVISAQLYITLAQATAGGVSATYIVNAVFGAAAGTGNAVVGTVTLLAGSTAASTAPTVAWDGTGASLTRHLTVSFGTSSHILVKMVVARRAAGSVISIP